MQIGGVFSFVTKYIVNLNGDKVVRETQYDDFSPRVEVPFIPEYDSEANKENFLDSLRNIRIGEWDAYYEPSRFRATVLDGTQWELCIVYSKGRKVKKSGNNLYPYNFNQLLDLMWIPQIEEMEEIQEINEL